MKNPHLSGIPDIILVMTRHHQRPSQDKAQRRRSHVANIDRGIIRARSAATRFRAKADPSIRVRGFICPTTAYRKTANCGSLSLQFFAKIEEVFFSNDFLLYRAVLRFIHSTSDLLARLLRHHERQQSTNLTTSPPSQSGCAIRHHNLYIEPYFYRIAWVLSTNFCGRYTLYIHGRD